MNATLRIAALARRPRHALAGALLIAIACLAPSAPADAGELEALFKRAANRVKQEALRGAEDKIVDSTRRATGQADGTPGNAGERSTQSVGAAYAAPRADVRVSSGEQVRWATPGRGAKFEPMQEAPRQVIAANPYLSPEKPFFGSMHGLQCTADGGLVVAGEGGLDAAGGVAGNGWWLIAPDGAISSRVSRPYDSPGTAHPSSRFSVASDDSLLVATRDAVLRIAGDGTARTLLGGMDNPGMPVQDPSGNVWVTDRQSCELRRIAPDGSTTTVVGADRSTCSELPPEDRINLFEIAWDPVHGELVSGGGLITARPTHDMRITLWRIHPDGQARRVYYTVKAGRSPIGQNIDTIWALTVDDQGRIVVASRLLADRARRQIMRLDEARGKLVVLTGQSFGKEFAGNDYRPGHEEAPYDGAAAHASFRDAKNLCYGPDRTLFVLDELQVRRLDPDGNVRTWAY